METCGFFILILIQVPMTGGTSDGVGSRRFQKPPNFLINIDYRKMKLSKLRESLFLLVRYSLISHVSHMFTVQQKIFFDELTGLPYALFLQRLQEFGSNSTQLPREHLCICGCCCFSYVIYMWYCLFTLGSTPVQCAVSGQNPLGMLGQKN